MHCDVEMVWVCSARPDGSRELPTPLTPYLTNHRRGVNMATYHMLVLGLCPLDRHLGHEYPSETTPDLRYFVQPSHSDDDWARSVGRDPKPSMCVPSHLTPLD